MSLSLRQAVLVCVCVCVCVCAYVCMCVSPSQALTTAARSRAEAALGLRSSALEHGQRAATAFTQAAADVSNQLRAAAGVLEGHAAHTSALRVAKVNEERGKRHTHTHTHIAAHMLSGVARPFVQHTLLSPHSCTHTRACAHTHRQANTGLSNLTSHLRRA